MVSKKATQKFDNILRSGTGNQLIIDIKHSFLELTILMFGFIRMPQILHRETSSNRQKCTFLLDTMFGYIRDIVKTFCMHLRLV